MNADRRIAEIVSLALLLVGCAIAAYALVTLPATIATHFSGPHADRYGSKYTLLIVPLVSIVVYFGFGWVMRVPVTQMNLTVRVTAENAERVRPVALAMLAWIKSSALLLCAVVELALTASAGGTLSPLIYFSLAFGLVPLLIAAIFVPALRRAGGAPRSTGNT